MGGRAAVVEEEEEEAEDDEEEEEEVEEAAAEAEGADEISKRLRFLRGGREEQRQTKQAAII